ncbi:hypothetical protein [Nostoc sp.]|uniref:hypothetical protein n=1 Tax=Nostoc sp. TaxID=1180 RepID=UPI002FFB1D24
MILLERLPHFESDRFATFSIPRFPCSTYHHQQPVCRLPGKKLKVADAVYDALA